MHWACFSLSPSAPSFLPSPTFPSLFLSLPLLFPFSQYPAPPMPLPSPTLALSLPLVSSFLPSPLYKCPPPFLSFPPSLPLPAPTLLVLSTRSRPHPHSTIVEFCLFSENLQCAH